MRPLPDEIALDLGGIGLDLMRIGLDLVAFGLGLVGIGNGWLTMLSSWGWGHGEDVQSKRKYDATHAAGLLHLAAQILGPKGAAEGCGGSSWWWPPATAMLT